MPATSLFFGGKIAQNYEDYLGSFLFEPYAIDLADRINWTGVSQILELACGSGRLTRHIVQQLPPTAMLTATDLYVDMIDVARSKITAISKITAPGKTTADRVKWAPEDMLHLSFGDESFDLVVCQFAVMLVPDQLKALAEIFRVLKPGGKVIFNTWTDLDYNKIWAICDKVLTSLLGTSPIGQDPGPFTLESKDVVLDMLKKTGFVNTVSTSVANTGEIESAQKAAFGVIYGLPVGLFIQKEGPERMPEILQALEERLKAELGDHPLRAPQKAWVFEATK